MTWIWKVVILYEQSVARVVLCAIYRSGYTLFPVMVSPSRISSKDGTETVSERMEHSTWHSLTFL